MDNIDKDKKHEEPNTEEGTKDVAKSETKLTSNEEIKDKTSVKSEEAGPSYFECLPGSIAPKVLHLNKTGISKSEVNIRQIITSNDATNAVNLTSLSFGPNFENVSENKEEEIALQNFIDLKKFMASCFKFSKEGSDPLGEIHTVSVVSTEVPQEVNVNLLSNNTQTDTEPSNKLVATNCSTVEPILSKLTSEHSKKKTSGNISELSDLGLAQRDSLSSIGSNVCRICMTRGRERLISPCNCKGSLANVHLSCLERWLNQVGRNHCELCGYSYPAIRTPRYTVLQALRLWFGNPRNRSHLQSDCLIFWLLSTVTAGLLAVCIVGTQYFVIEGSKIGKHGVAPRKDEGISHRITETAMDFFMAIVLCGYSVTVYLLWKDHYVMWNRWRRANVNVRLLLTPDANPVPFLPRQQYHVV